MVAVHSQFAKELAITKSTKGALFFEGGVNTEALFIEILDGIATGKIPRSYRMVLVGKEWGQGVLDCIDPLIKAKLADSYPLESILVTEDPEEAAAFLGLTKAGEETGGGPSAYGDLKRPQAPA
jgi:predicted Rossmann-fold nucleotide-binding protein